MAEEANGADVDLNIAGQKVNLRNVKSLNTIATVATLIMVCVIGGVGYVMLTAHASDTRDASKELVQAMKDVAQGLRENNCLQAVPPDRRDPELCKRLSR